MANEISLDDYQALAEFRYQIRRFLHFSEQVARSAGIEPQQHQLLLALKSKPEEKAATISYLADRLQLQHHSTVELIDRLVERNLVQRRKDETDQRRVVIDMTPHGEQVLQELSLYHRNELRTMGPDLAHALNALTLDRTISTGTAEDISSSSQRGKNDTKRG